MVQRISLPSSETYKSFLDKLIIGAVKAEKLIEKDCNGQVCFDYIDPEAPDVVAIGGLYLSLNNTDPGLTSASGGLGYGSWQRIAKGKTLIGVDEGDSDFNLPNLTMGGKTVVPSGTVSQPSFTGTSSQSTSSDSAGTPSGTVSQPTFTGSALSSHTHAFTGNAVNSSLVSAGTPAGTNSTPTFTGSALATHTHTFTGSALANHSHELPFQIPTTTTTRQIAAATFGTGTSRAATAVSTTGTANTTSAAVALTQSVSAGTPAGTNASVSAGTPAGTVSAPTFTGSALATHQHSTTATGSNSSDSAGTPSGTVSQPTFTGSALSVHSHTLTPSGTVSQPTFTGSSVSVIQPSLTVYIWLRVA